jgi:hypothetical protein
VAGYDFYDPLPLYAFNFVCCLRMFAFASCRPRLSNWASSTFSLASHLAPSFAQIAHLLAASEAFVWFCLFSTFPFYIIGLGDNQPWHYEISLLKSYALK